MERFSTPLRCPPMLTNVTKVALFLYCCAALFSNEVNADGELPLPRIDRDPQSLNVSILDYAQFSCTASNVDTIFWLVDGKAIETIPNLVDTQQSHTHVNMTTTTYTIEFFIGKNLNYTLLNGSSITCQGYEYSGIQSSSMYTNRSQPAILLLEGILGSPVNLTANIKSDVLIVEWLPPYTLQGLNVSYYQGNFSVNTNNSKDPFLLQTFEVAEISASFSIFDASNCTVYIICVQAISPAGPGTVACIDTSRIGVPWKLKPEQISVDVTTTDNYLLLLYEFEQNHCAGDRADVVTIDIDYGTGWKTVSSPAEDSLLERFLTYEVLLPASALGSRAKTTVTLTNSGWSTISEPKYTDLLLLQDINITVINTTFSIVVFCTFISSAESQACQIVYQCTATDHSKLYPQYIFNLKKLENSNVSEIGTLPCNLQCVMYDLRAYNVYANGKVDDTPSAYEDSIICYASTAEMPIAPSANYVQPTVECNPDMNNQIITITLSTLTGLLLLILAMVLTCTIVIISRQRRIKELQRITKYEESTGTAPLQAKIILY